MLKSSRTHPVKRAYRVQEVPEIFGIGRTKLYQLMKDGKLRTVKIGGRRLIPAESLEALLKGEAA